jgi:hypothetical protein
MNKVPVSETQSLRCICVTRGPTDLPPLTLAIVLLEETLVVRDTVLAEHESKNPRQKESVRHSAIEY